MKKCSKCGSLVGDDMKFCKFCGASAYGAVDFDRNTNYEIPLGNNHNNYRISSICGIFSGVLSIILGFILMFRDIGNYEASSTYGGDAYTGIQNAAAQTANNIRELTYIAKFGFSSLLIVIGIALICFFVYTNQD